MTGRSKKESPGVAKWSPKLKGRGSVLAIPNSEANGAAAAALSVMKSLDRIRATGGEVGDCKVRRVAERHRASVTEGPERPKETKKRPAVHLVAVVLVVLASCVAGANLRRSGHKMSGTATLERRPMANASVRLHSADGSVLSAPTDESGRFELASVASGEYKITLLPGEGEQMSPAYCDPDSTPFSVNINRDAEGLQLPARRVAPKPRKRTWTPGVD